MKWVVLSKKKKEIPLFHILNATATFQNFEERPIEDSIFDLPKSHKHVNFVKKRKNMADYVNEADEKNAEKSAASDKSNTSDSLPPSDEEQQPSDEERWRKTFFFFKFVFVYLFSSLLLLSLFFLVSSPVFFAFVFFKELWADR